MQCFWAGSRVTAARAWGRWGVRSRRVRHEVPMLVPAIALSGWLASLPLQAPAHARAAAPALEARAPRTSGANAVGEAAGPSSVAPGRREGDETAVAPTTSL